MLMMRGVRGDDAVCVYICVCVRASGWFSVTWLMRVGWRDWALWPEGEACFSLRRPICIDHVYPTGSVYVCKCVCVYVRVCKVEGVILIGWCRGGLCGGPAALVISLLITIFYILGVASAGLTPLSAQSHSSNVIEQVSDWMSLTEPR